MPSTISPSVSSPAPSSPPPRQHNLPRSISVVVPCFNEEEVIEQLRARLLLVLNALNIPYEVVLVDDGSSDGTWQLLQQFQQADPHFKVVRLSRNFGHQVAFTCGLDQANGETVLIMDADLQDPPELLPQMVELWSRGYDVVYGQRRTRNGDGSLKRFFAFAFYRLFERLTKITIPRDTGDFRLMDRRAVHALQTLREHHRFIRGMVSWIGFPQIALAYDRPERLAGVTKYPFKRSLFLAIEAITSFSYAPLRLASYLGAILSIIAFVYILVVIGLKIAGINFPGYTSIMGSILLLGGVQLLVLGLIGEYVGRIFEQGQSRPLYLIQEIHGEPLPTTPALKDSGK